MSTRSAQQHGATGSGPGALSGLELQHDFHIVLPSWRSWGAVAEALNNAGAEVQSLQLLRQPEGYASRCRVINVSSEDARRISCTLVERGVATQSNVEHLMLRVAP